MQHISANNGTMLTLAFSADDLTLASGTADGAM
jgi:hypothetical protein